MNGYLSAMRGYASFGGRTSRGEFWGFTIVAAAIIFVALLVSESTNTANSVGSLLALLVILAHFLPSLAVSVRRLHDTDRSGWWLLINVVPLIGIILLVVWACQAGTPGRNRFGSDPLNIVGSEAAPATVTFSGTRDVIAEVERLAQLRASGSLSDSEFEVLKAQALARG